MTRLGKIARLPRRIREELNRKLSDGEVGKHLVAWLNTLPEAHAVLATEFGGRPINEQNLSDWKQGGYEDWLRHQEARAWVQSLAEEEDELRAESGSIPLAERLTAPVLVGLGRLLRDATAASGGAEQGRLMLGVAQQLAQLRRGDAQTERLRLERERWETEQEAALEEKRKAAKSAATSKRIRERLYPELDEDFLPRANALPPEIEACLTANERLRKTHEHEGDQAQSR